MSRATRADSGWYAATPIPDTAMNSRVSGYEPLRPLDATPSPPRIVLTGSSQGMARRSVRTPNTGCATEDSTDAASAMPEAAA